MSTLDRADLEAHRDDWDIFEEELRHRELTSLRYALVRTGLIDVRGLDAHIKSIAAEPAADEQNINSEQPHPVNSDVQTCLDHAFWSASRDPELVALLTAYVYAKAMELWELTSEWAAITNFIDAARDAATRPPTANAVISRSGVEFDLLRLMLELTRSVIPAMQVENGLNCSCPIGMRDAAAEAHETATRVLSQLDLLPAGHRGFQNLIRSRALIDQTYFGAVGAVTEAVVAYIDGGLEASETIRGKIAAVVRAENSDVLSGDVYQSELRTHRLALQVLEHAWPRVYVNSAKVIYCYPFAFQGVPPTTVVDAIRNRTHPWTLLGQKTSWQEMALSDMWDGTAPPDAHFAGISIALPEISVYTTAKETITGFDIDIRLSQLGNHYVRVEHWLTDATVHDLNQAMRRATAQMGEEQVMFGPHHDDAVVAERIARAHDDDGNSHRWVGIAKLARDLIKALADRLTAQSPEDPDAGLMQLTLVSPATAAHVIVAARTLSTEAEDNNATEAGFDQVTKAFGASLVYHPIRQAAVALEEWVRYPLPNAPRNLLEGFGFLGDFAFRTINTTFALLGAVPEFLVRDHEEAAEFVASLPAVLQSWQEEIRTKTPNFSNTSGLSLLDINAKKLEVRKVLADARSLLAKLRSPGLTLTGVQRLLLDRLFDSAGIPRLERELEVEFELADAGYAALSEHQALIESRRADAINRNLGIATVLFGAASVAGLLQLLDSAFTFPKWGIVAECAVLVVATVLLGLLLWQRGREKPTRSNDEE